MNQEELQRKLRMIQFMHEMHVLYISESCPKPRKLRIERLNCALRDESPGNDIASERHEWPERLGKKILPRELSQCPKR